jgi:hypothetical protein
MASLVIAEGPDPELVRRDEGAAFALSYAVTIAS